MYYIKYIGFSNLRFYYKIFHNFHILSLSSYPFLIYFLRLFLCSSLVVFFKYRYFNFFVFFIFFLVFLWSKDIYMEGLSGYHNYYVQDGFKFGMVLFVFSELMFFFGIFWFFFDTALTPIFDSGDFCSSVGVVLVNPFGVPFLNSCILLGRGASVTWSHFCLLSNKECSLSLFLTIFLAFYFLLIQFIEYSESMFSLSDGVYGRIFYMSTGFHGLHVFFGSLFLLFCFFRIMSLHFNFDHHLGFEFGIIYWHFVDVVWLFLFVFVYWWSY